VNTWKVILATLVLYGAGVVTGGLLIHFSSQTRLGHNPRSANGTHSAPPSAGGIRFEFLRRMGRDLDLTPEQRERIDKILKESQEQTRKAVHDEFQRTKAAFREVLTPQQQAQFDELLKRPQRTRESKRSPGSGERTPAATSVTNSP
jgi:Spy/CpxP family protein refolding chaperone